jgi:hypothetical protein
MDAPRSSRDPRNGVPSNALPSISEQNMKTQCLSSLPIGYLVTALILAGCSEPAPAPEPRSRTSAVSPAQEAVQAAGGHDEKWANFSGAVPGFGGMYYNDDGDLVVILKDTVVQKGAARAMFAAFIGQSHRPQSLVAAGHAATMLFRGGTYDYQELLTYKDAVSVALRVVNSSLSSIGVDELTNSVRIGVADSQLLQRVHDIAIQAGIPASAMTIARADRETRLSTTMYAKDTITPVVAGEQLWTNGTFCTIGLPVMYAPDSLPGILLSGHCAGANGDSVGLADRSLNIHYIGAIVNSGQDSYLCSHGTCRHADVALASLKSSVQYYHGGIARGNTGPAIETTAYWSGTWGDPQAYDPSSNYGTNDGPFMVAADFSPGSEVVGQWISKFGIATGWTEGQISNASTDIQTDQGYWVAAAVVVSAGAWAGDSGSGVFAANGTIGNIDGNTPVNFDGVVFAGGDGATIGGHYVYRHFDYSPLYQVRVQQLWRNYIYTHR